MILFLTSSPTGPLDGSRQVEGLDEMNQFADNLRRYWKDNSRCLMIAASPHEWDRNDEMICFFQRAVEISGLSCSSFQILDSRTRDITEDELRSFDVIFLGGGHVPTQHEFFEKISLREKIKDFSGIIIGISAGTMNSAEVVYAQPELPGESVRDDYVRFFPGLGLTAHQILPHYQMVKDFVLDGRRLYDDITREDSYGHEFLVLPDGSYLLSENGTETVWGEAYLFSNGTMKQISKTDQKVSL